MIFVKYSKYILNFLLLFFLFTQFSLAADECIPFDESRDCLTLEQTDERMQGYKVVGNPRKIVFYGYCRILCADATLKPIVLKNQKEDVYARDKNYVFFRVTPLKELNPREVKIKETGKPNYYLAYDKTNVYLNTILFPEIDPETFKFLDTSFEDWTSWFKDKNHVYKLTHADNSLEDKLELLKGAEPDHFYFGYETTPNAVYWYGKKIPEADVASVQLFHLGYAKDKNNVYFEGAVEYGADVKSFTEFGGYFLDKNGEHYEKKLFKDIKKFKQQYIDNNKSPKIVDEALSTTIQIYESKYPGYTPKPAQPPAGSPEEAELKKMQAAIKQEQIKKFTLWSIPALGALLVIGGGVWVWRRKKKKKI